MSNGKINSTRLSEDQISLIIDQQITAIEAKFKEVAKTSDVFNKYKKKKVPVELAIVLGSRTREGLKTSLQDGLSKLRGINADAVSKLSDQKDVLADIIVKSLYAKPVKVSGYQMVRGYISRLNEILEPSKKQGWVKWLDLGMKIVSKAVEAAVILPMALGKLAQNAVYAPKLQADETSKSFNFTSAPVDMESLSKFSADNVPPALLAANAVSNALIALTNGKSVKDVDPKSTAVFGAPQPVKEPTTAKEAVVPTVQKEISAPAVTAPVVATEEKPTIKVTQVTSAEVVNPVAQGKDLQGVVTASAAPEKGVVNDAVKGTFTSNVEPKSISPAAILEQKQNGNGVSLVNH